MYHDYVRIIIPRYTVYRIYRVYSIKKTSFVQLTISFDFVNDKQFLCNSIPVKLGQSPQIKQIKNQLLF